MKKLQIKPKILFYLINLIKFFGLTKVDYILYFFFFKIHLRYNPEACVHDFIDDK